MTTPPHRHPVHRHSIHLQHTYFLLAGLSIAYIGFLYWLGPRWIVLLSGAVIVGGAIVFWFRQLQSSIRTPAPAIHLLQTDTFLSRLAALDDRIPEASQSFWRSVQHQTKAIHQAARQIAQQESTLIPDLLETLHTVLDLVEQLAQALQVIQQVQTPRYQALAQQRLQNSQVRLQQTHDQLQELRDQLALESLERSALTGSSGISQRLQTLIAENGKGILED